jgi:hypothetical protein
MIIYWAWPPDGAGHATKTAAICRHLKNNVLVVRGNGDPRINKALDYFDIPYVVIENRSKAENFVLSHRNDFIVLDDSPFVRFKNWVDVYIWRLNRPQKLPGVPTIRVEGPGSLWPVLMLEDHEILDKHQARRELGIPQDRFTIIGVTSTARPGVVEATEPDFLLTPDNFWPALKYLRAADHVVGCIGYNLYAEVTYLGLEATWIKAPNSPDQAVRIHNPPSQTPQRGCARKVAEMIDQMHG